MSLTLATDVPTLTIRPWSDEVIDIVGHDPRSLYVETFWLSVLGPSTTWLLRHFVSGFDDHPEHYEIEFIDTARAIGLGDRLGRSSPLAKALTRCMRFEMARLVDPTTLAVRRKLPSLTRSQVLRLPLDLQIRHQEWLDQQLEPQTAGEAFVRTRELAATLRALGEDESAMERQLLRWRIHPSEVRDAITVTRGS